MQPAVYSLQRVEHLCFNPLRGSSSLQHVKVFHPLTPVKFQSSTRFLEFATKTDTIYSVRREVSILYEVPRVCNEQCRQLLLEGYGVSILYEVPRVCNVSPYLLSSPCQHVSILYEVPRVCNSSVRRRGGRSTKFQSSTRFLEFATEALAFRKAFPHEFQSSTRFLEFATVWRAPTLFLDSCFNPLRGSSSLQPSRWNAFARAVRVSILYEVPRVCNPEPLASRARRSLFQSSTRFLEFAT